MGRLALPLLGVVLCLFGEAPSAQAQGNDAEAAPKSAAVYCKLCGQKYYDARTLLRNTCPRNHGGKHVLFEGDAAQKWICENCGLTYTSLKDLTRNTCPHGNGATHVPYRGGIRTQYTCRWCGKKYSDLRTMTRNTVRKCNSELPMGFLCLGSGNDSCLQHARKA